jgi:predicted transcriptional regulator
MKKPKPNALSRRERQIMDVLYKLERATVAEVRNKLADKPSYSTVRAQLRVLEEKGHVRHEEHGLRYVYVPLFATSSIPFSRALRKTWSQRCSAAKVRESLGKN